MEQREARSDRLGRPFGEKYSLILQDPHFERRLKAFDPNLKLVFNQVNKRWVILEWAMDNSGWNVLLTAEDDQKNPLPLGEWIFNKLYVWRHNYLEKRKNPDQWWKNLEIEAEQQQLMMDAASSRSNQAILIDEVNEYRRAARELRNEPTSDVTAGYQKIQPKSKGSTCNFIIQP